LKGLRTPGLIQYQARKSLPILLTLFSPEIISPMSGKSIEEKKR